MKFLKATAIFFLTLWQLPQCLLGAVIWLVCRIKHRNRQIFGERVLTEWGLHSGLSLGYFMFVNENATFNTRLHEFGHTKQSQYLGWFYLLVIGLPSIIWASCFDRYRKRKAVSYYSFFCENWADKLGGVARRV